VTAVVETLARSDGRDCRNCSGDFDRLHGESDMPRECPIGWSLASLELNKSVRFIVVVNPPLVPPRFHL